MNNDKAALKVSIITVAFNSEETIRDTLDSVLNQTHPPSEYIIIDGGSTDKTIEIVESYRPRFEQKGVKYTIISEPDNGIYDAMNKGILLSSGDIVGMINSDDWYEPDAIKKAVETYQKTGYDMMFADLIIHGERKAYVKKAKLGRWVTSRTWNHPTTFTKRAVYDANMFPCKSMYDDFNLYIKLRKEGKSIIVLNETLAHFRMGGTSNKKTLREAIKRTKDRYRIYRENGYSRVYFFECLFIETAKIILS